jgi:condensation domain-containing protein/thioesterase superfamily protein/phosphopantetheine binding protein
MESGEMFVMPCTVAQQRFWMLEQISPGNTALLIPIAFQLSGPLDAALLQRALNAIAARHEILRTHFEVIDDEPKQVIAAEGSLPLGRSDPGPVAPETMEELMRREMLAEAHRPLDFSRAPLLRATLVPLAAEEHLLMLTAHHIACDGWSNGILVRELAAFYDAFRHEREAALPPLTIQYADYAVWQNGWLSTPAFRGQLDFWKEMLAGDLPALDFPADFSRQAAAAQAPGAILETLLLPGGLTESLREFCRQEGVTPFMILYSAYVALLHRYTGQDDFLVGTTAANRNRPELEPLIGLFANLIIPRSRVPAGITFRAFLAAQRELLLNSFANHEAPFEKVLEEAGRGIALQTHFLFQKAFMQPDAGGGVQIQPLRSVSPGSTFELAFGIVERASEGIRLQMEYRTSLFQGAVIRRFLHHFQALLESIVAHPDTALDDLSIFAAGEREELESRLAGPRRDVPFDPASILAGFDRQLEIHLGQEAAPPFLSPVELPPGVVLIALDAKRRLLPLGIPGDLYLGPSGSSIDALVKTGFIGRNTEGSAALWGRADDVVVHQGFRVHRRAIRPASSTPPPVVSGRASMQNILHRQLLDIWEKILKVPDLTIEDNFFECGGTSFLALRMMIEAGKLHGKPLPLSLLLTGATVAHLTRYILEAQRDDSANRPLIPLRTEGSRPPLFFLHGDWAGGGFYCRQLADAFAADQPFYALPPYRRTEPKILTVAEMAAFHLAAIREHTPHGPYLLGGYCIGATVAVEMARQLIAQGETVGHVFLVDPPVWSGPAVRRFWPWIDRLGNLRQWDLEKKIDFMDRSVISVNRWLKNPWREKWAAIRRRLPLPKSTPSDGGSAATEPEFIGEELLEGLDYSLYSLAHRLYRATPLSIPATFYFPEATPDAGLGRLSSASRLDPARYKVERLPGDHTTSMTRHIDVLAQKIAHVLSRDV